MQRVYSVVGTNIKCILYALCLLILFSQWARFGKFWRFVRYFNSFHSNLCYCTWMSSKWQINAFIFATIFSQPIICFNSLCTTLKLFAIILEIHQRNQKRHQHAKTNSAKKFLWCNDCAIEILYVRHVTMPA